MSENSNSVTVPCRIHYAEVLGIGLHSPEWSWHECAPASGCGGCFMVRHFLTVIARPSCKVYCNFSFSAHGFPQEWYVVIIQINFA
ncbi:hypothetical protein [Stenotrophomonas phage CM2]